MDDVNDQSTEPGQSCHSLQPPVGPADDVDITGDACPKCGTDLWSAPCTSIDCDDGFYHDCGEDCCCCADPYPNRRCEECLGTGYHVWCHNCGWDVVHKVFLNESDKEPNPAFEPTADRRGPSVGSKGNVGA